MHADPVLFAQNVAREVGDAPDAKQRPIYLICRSGKRTVDAAQALEAAGFSNVTNILHGFEGELDAQFHRSKLTGWRHDGLPWEQM
jgi:rhodanese-related sulfurtransferase